jgi:SAM-dependent methyltransferase
MESSHLEELIQLEDSYWWHVAKRKLVTSILKKEFAPPGRLVEGGIGSARNLVVFRELGYRVTGFDVMTESVDHARRRGLDDVRIHDLSLPWPLEPDSTDVVVLLDVLEHLQDPVEVMKHVRRILKPGGGIVFTVPAYRWLYGDWDKRLGHFRRYTAHEMKRQAAAAGLHVHNMTHWNAFTFPAAVAVRGYQRLFPAAERGTEFPRVTAAMNQMLLSMAGVERWLVRNSRVPFGLSLVGVLKK